MNGMYVEFTKLATKGKHTYAKDTRGRVWIQVDKEEWEQVYPEVEQPPHIKRPITINELMLLMSQRHVEVM